MTTRLAVFALFILTALCVAGTEVQSTFDKFKNTLDITSSRELTVRKSDNGGMFIYVQARFTGPKPTNQPEAMIMYFTTAGKEWILAAENENELRLFKNGERIPCELLSYRRRTAETEFPNCEFAAAEINATTIRRLATEPGWEFQIGKYESTFTDADRQAFTAFCIACKWLPEPTTQPTTQPAK